MSEKVHARLSPSARHRWRACPGSVELCADIPRQSSTVADDGTFSHSVLENCIKTGLPIEFMEGFQENGFTLDKERIERIKVPLDYVESAVKEGAQVFSEVGVNLKPILGREDVFGTCDILMLHKGKGVVEVVDYKDGFNEVVAKNNPQLEVYALGVLPMISHDTQWHTMRMTVIQPRMVEMGKDPISSWDVPITTLSTETVRTLAKECKLTDESKELVPGPVQCKYCPASTKCPAVLRDSAYLISASREDGLDWDPAKMTDEVIVEIFKRMPVVEKMFEKLQEEVLERLKKGEKIPGLKLTQGRGSRKWNAEEPVMVKRLKGMGIPTGELYTKKLLTPAQAQKLTWEKNGEKKKLTDRQKNALATEYTSYLEGALKVSLADDPGETVTRFDNQSEFFQAIEESKE